MSRMNGLTTKVARKSRDNIQSHWHTHTSQISALRSKYLTNNNANSQFMFGMYDSYSLLLLLLLFCYFILVFSLSCSAREYAWYVRVSEFHSLPFIYIFIPFTLADICVVFLLAAALAAFVTFVVVCYCISRANCCRLRFFSPSPSHPSIFFGRQHYFPFKWKEATLQNDVRASVLNTYFWLRFHV